MKSLIVLAFRGNIVATKIRIADVHLIIQIM